MLPLEHIAACFEMLQSDGLQSRLATGGAYPSRQFRTAARHSDIDPARPVSVNPVTRLPHSNVAGVVGAVDKRLVQILTPNAAAGPAGSWRLPKIRRPDSACRERERMLRKGTNVGDSAHTPSMQVWLGTGCGIRRWKRRGQSRLRIGRRSKTRRRSRRRLRAGQSANPSLQLLLPAAS
jgi:hypothetical protein